MLLALPLRAAVPLSAGEEWFDDWYTIQEIDSQTYIIGEPRYWQQNYNYLILGEERALLVDTGPGKRDIRPVVESLTDLPLSVICTHMHFDHSGNLHLFERVVMPAGLRHKSGSLHVSMRRSLTPLNRRIAVSRWLEEGDQIELGGRQLQVFPLPGHSPDSIVLADERRGQLFVGDFIYPGGLVAFTPDADLDDYLVSCRKLLGKLQGPEKLYAAHASAAHPSPVVARRDVADLEAALIKIMAGELEYQREFLLRDYPVNERMHLLVAF